VEFRDIDLTVIFDKQLADPSPEDISISIKDDLFSFFSTGLFSVKDHSSILLEYRALNDGSSLGLGVFSLAEDAVEPTSFIVDSSSAEQSLENGILSRRIDAKLIHEKFNSLGVEGSAIEGTVSDVVSEIIETLGFKEKIISKSGGTSIWYRPLINEQDFIEKILLPKAVSESNNFSPFFAFTTSDGIFHFEDYESMMNKSVKESFSYRPAVEVSYDPTLLTSVIPFTNGVKKSRKYWNRIIHTFSVVDFSENEYFRTIQDRLPGGSLVIGDAEKVSDYEVWDDHLPENPLSQSRIDASDNYKSRKIFFQESFVIITARPFSNLHAGDKISLTITTKDLAGYSDSLYFTGDYLIEASNHQFRGSEERGFSEFLISRSTTTTPSDHLKTEKFIK